MKTPSWRLTPVPEAAQPSLHQNRRATLAGLSGTSRQGIGFLGLSVVTSLLTLAFTILAARLLRPEPYGGFMALFGLWSMAAMPSVAIQLLAARHLAVAPATTPSTASFTVSSTAHGFRQQVVRWLVRMLIITSFPLAAVTWHVSPTLKLDGFTTVAVVLLAWWLGAFVAWLRGRAQAQNLLVRFGASGAVEAGVRLVLLLVLLKGLAIMPSLGLLLSMGIACLAVAVVLPSRLLHHDVAPIGFTALLSSAGSALAVTLAIGFLTNLDLVWARHALDDAQSGLFAAGTLASRPFILLGAVAGTVVLPNVAAGRYTRVTLLRLLILLIGAGVLAAGLAHVLAEPAIRLLFGQEYLQAAGVVRLAVWGGAVMAPGIMLAHAFLGLGSFRMTLGFIVSIALLIILVFSLPPSLVSYWGGCITISTLYLAVGSIVLGSFNHCRIRDESE
jgi:O-antigen/teichoic acid export membrane protein